jgi:hypothetical protein
MKEKPDPLLNPELCCDEDLGAIDPGATNAFADLALVSVGGCRIDQSVAVPNRGLYRIGGLLRRRRNLRWS